MIKSFITSAEADFMTGLRVSKKSRTRAVCGSCVKRGPMDAIPMKFSAESTNQFRKAVVVNTDCGVCVHKCKPKSLTLRRKPPDQITEPPQTLRQNVMENAAAGLAALEKRK